MLTTAEYWEIDGVALNTLAYNIETMEGREGLPPRVGENVQVGNQRGRVWRPKRVEQRPLTLAMWVRGCDVNGMVAEDQLPVYRENWAMLKKLFGVTDRLQGVTKRVRFPDGVRSYTALVEAVGTMDLKPVFKDAGRFIVELMMPDPYWYGPPAANSIAASTPANGVSFPVVFSVNFGGGGGGGEAILENAGDVNAPVSFKIVGPLSNVSILHVAQGKTLTLAYNVPAGSSVILNSADRSVLDGSASRYQYLTSAQWFDLLPGNNEIRVFGTGSGYVEASWKPPYN